MIDLKVTRITVLLHGPGQDEINLYLDEAPTTHPELSLESPGAYPATVSLKTRKGYCKEWLLKMGVDLSKVQVISMVHGRLEGFPEDLRDAPKMGGRHTSG